MTPVIAIVGRPNVGKSTLFNRLVGGRTAIVEDYPGVTRDRHYGDAEVLGRRLIVIDTGGFEPKAEEGMLAAMREQASVAIAEADAVIVLYDGRDGLLPADEEIARMLERGSTPVFHAVNKIDGPRQHPMVAEFYALGVETLHDLSAQHGGGVLDLMEEVLAALPPETAAGDDGADEAFVRVAVIGKPNAGKSTLVNRLLGEDRLLVSDVPGTTRDAIDTWLERPPDAGAVAAAQAAVEEAERRVAAVEASEAAASEVAALPIVVDPDEEDIDVDEVRWQVAEDPVEARRTLEMARAGLARAQAGRRYLLIDTAGIRRRKWVKTRIEKISIVQAFKSIDRADVCLLLIDATAGVTDQDAKLASLVQAKGRACLILVNKWDAVAAKDTWTAGQYVKQLRSDLGFVAYAPILFVSAMTGQRCHKVLAEVDRVARAHRLRVATAGLNRAMADAVRGHQPPAYRGRRLRFFYASQVATRPPTFLFWVNEPDGVREGYRRYLINQIRSSWDFEGTPIKLVTRSKGERRAKR